MTESHNPLVLLVDDSLTVLTHLRGVLELVGNVDVATASNGIEATALLDEREPQLVICDVNMPEMGGMEFLELCHTRGLTPGVPFLMLTTEMQSDLIRRARSWGASGWLVKPMADAQLIQTVRSLLDSRVEKLSGN